MFSNQPKTISNHLGQRKFIVCNYFQFEKVWIYLSFGKELTGVGLYHSDCLTAPRLSSPVSLPFGVSLAAVYTVHVTNIPRAILCSVDPQPHISGFNPLPDDKFLDSSKLKEFADDNFEFDENGRKLSKRVENTVGKGEIARYEQFLPFPQCFQMSCFPGASKGVIVWKRVKWPYRTDFWSKKKCWSPALLFFSINVSYLSEK